MIPQQPQQNPFELEQPKVPGQAQVQPQVQAPPLGGLAQLVPQEQQQMVEPEGGYLGLAPTEGGSYFSIDPTVISKMWAPQQQAPPVPLPGQQPPF